MTENLIVTSPVLITGDSKLVSSVAVCLALSQQPVVVLTQHKAAIFEHLDECAEDLERQGMHLNLELVNVIDKPANDFGYSLAIILTNESLQVKKNLLALVEGWLPPDKTIAINTESIALSEIQHCSKYPSRIIGVNWVEPAHTTFFLEVISNAENDQQLVTEFARYARENWKKDPYIITADKGIRSRLMCALIREAFYLVENGYVSFEDIDRACRNDAGSYLPFAGNFRYMDLMGTYIYGVVMKDMNPDLTKQQHVPAFFKSMMQQNRLGMDSAQGFYDYPDGEAEKWNRLARNFSYQVRDIIEKYHHVI